MHRPEPRERTRVTSGGSVPVVMTSSPCRSVRCGWRGYVRPVSRSEIRRRVAGNRRNRGRSPRLQHRSLVSKSPRVHGRLGGCGWRSDGPVRAPRPCVCLDRSLGSVMAEVMEVRFALADLSHTPTAITAPSATASGDLRRLHGLASLVRPSARCTSQTGCSRKCRRPPEVVLPRGPTTTPP